VPVRVIRTSRRTRFALTQTSLARPLQPPRGPAQVSRGPVCIPRWTAGISCRPVQPTQNCSTPTPNCSNSARGCLNLTPDCPNLAPDCINLTRACTHSTPTGANPPKSREKQKIIAQLARTRAKLRPFPTGPALNPFPTERRPSSSRANQLTPDPRCRSRSENLKPFSPLKEVFNS